MGQQFNTDLRSERTLHQSSPELHTKTTMCMFTSTFGNSNQSSGSGCEGETVINIVDFKNWHAPINSSRLQMDTGGDSPSMWMLSFQPAHNQSGTTVKLIRLDHLQSDLEVRLQLGVGKREGRIGCSQDSLASWKMSFPSRSRYSSPLEADLDYVFQDSEELSTGDGNLLTVHCHLQIISNVENIVESNETFGETSSRRLFFGPNQELHYMNPKPMTDMRSSIRKKVRSYTRTFGSDLKQPFLLSNF